MLKYDDLLVFSHVVSLIEFNKSLELRIAAKVVLREQQLDDDIPFLIAPQRENMKNKEAGIVGAASSAGPFSTTVEAANNIGTQEIKIPHHWNYFLALDDDVMRLSRYIELTEDNFAAYSLEMARLLSAAASEVDVVAKQICQRLNAASTADRMNDYRAEIGAAHPEIAGAKVHIPKFGLTLNPWEQWDKGASPVWWKAYTNVKHHRHTHFSDANLENILNAVAGLFRLLLYFYPDEARNAQLSPDPSLFRAGLPFYTDFAAWGPKVTMYSLDLIDLTMQRLRGAY